MAFLPSDPARRDELRRLRREMRARRRAAQAADPLFVAAQLARKQAQREARRAAYAAVKARRRETGDGAQPRELGERERSTYRVPATATPEPDSAAPEREPGERGSDSRAVEEVPNNVLPFRRRE